MILSLKEFQLHCLKAHVAFVSYSLPGTGVPVTLFAKDSDVKLYRSITDIDIQEGFILSPFQSEDLPVVVIPQQNKLMGWEIEIEKLPIGNMPKTEPDRQLTSVNASFQQYAQQIDVIQENISSGKAKKVVLSRTKVLPGLDNMHIPDVFEELVKRYKLAFVYLICTSHSGIWIGATPESMLNIDKTDFSTMALAGTKRFSESTNIYWEDKELKEHAFVADYVRQKLTLGGYAFQESARETVCAGNVIHLRTSFNGTLSGNDKAWKNLVSLLYPTPAICGTESEATLQLIRTLEKHQREYYTGILGPFNEAGKTNLFINLRCMKVLDGAALLFAGGGVIDASSALKEWEETEMKFNTLTEVIEKVEERKRLADEHA